MTLPDPATPRKPRRLGLYAPFIALGVAVLIWSGVWLWLTSTVEQRLDAYSRSRAAAGGRFDWSRRTVHGFPFRIDVDLTGVRWADASGLEVGAPVLKSEAFAWAPSHWVAVAPAGLTVTRPGKGQVAVAAKALRASLFDLGAHPPRFSLEGMGLTFMPAPGAMPVFVQSAAELHIHTRAGPDDQGAFYIELDKSMVRPQSLLGRIADGKPLTLIADAIYSHAAAFRGATWGQKVAAWGEAGGSVEVRQLLIEPGDARLDARGESLTVDRDGRLRGGLDATLTQAPRVLVAMAQSGATTSEAARLASVVLSAAGGAPAVRTTLNFQAGRTTLGPVALAPAPKVY